MNMVLSKLEEGLLTDIEKEWGARVWCPELGLTAGLSAEEQEKLITALKRAYED